MKSLISELSTEKFPRIRVGTGTAEKINDLASYVLEKVQDDDYLKLQKGINSAAEAVTHIMKNGIDSAMNKFN